MSVGHSIASPARFPSANDALPPRSAADTQWRRLNAERRLQLVAQALRESDGIVDLFPLAL